MKKILSGVLGLVAVTAIVAGTAYAVFTSQATVSGISVDAGNAGLEIMTQQGWGSDFPTGLSLHNVYPGYVKQTPIQLYNNSNSVVSLLVSAQLTSATNWPNLANAVQVAVNDSTNSTGTDYHTLAEWNAAPIAFPGAALAHGDTATYNVYVRVDPSAGNEIAGQSLSNIVFTLTGTQQ